MSKRIYKSSKDKVFAGVCGGVAEYFNIDPVIVRLIWVIATLVYGTGLIIYIVAAIILPEDDCINKSITHENEENYDSERGKQILGIAFIAFGILFIAKRYLYWIDNDVLIAAAFIGIGVFLFLRNRSDNDE